MPELAVPAAQHQVLRDIVVAQRKFLIAGVAKPPAGLGQPGANVVDLSVPSVMGPVDYEQTKHHRWKLDKSQILQYGLGSILDPDNKWREIARALLGDDPNPRPELKKKAEALKKWAQSANVQR